MCRSEEKNMRKNEHASKQQQMAHFVHPLANMWTNQFPRARLRRSSPTRNNRSTGIGFVGRGAILHELYLSSLADLGSVPQRRREDRTTGEICPSTCPDSCTPNRRGSRADTGEMVTGEDCVFTAARYPASVSPAPAVAPLLEPEPTAAQSVTSSNPSKLAPQSALIGFVLGMDSYPG